MTDLPTTSPWLRRWSVLTVCAAVATLGLGSAVTNFKAGMADRAWPTLPTALLSSSPEQLANVPWVIEHSHRLAAYIAGICAVVLAVWLWRTERRRWVCWVGTAAVLGVGIQGLFGGLRVTEHVRWGLEFRLVHGCFAPVVLGLLASVAVFTSRAWQSARTTDHDDPQGLWRAARHALALVYLQIVFGVVLRHTYHPLAQRLHLLTAFAAMGGVVWLVWRLREGERPLRTAGVVLAVLLGLQIILGVEAWMTQFGSGTLPEMLPVTARRVAVRSAHVLGGSLLFATTLAAALLARREAVNAVDVAATTARLEGAT